jgi:K+-transporting ATPase c subunit
MTERDPLSQLGGRLAAARHLAPVARYRELRSLALEIKSAIAAEQDAAIAEAAATSTYEQVAQEAEISASEVNRRITAHRQRTGAPPRRGRRPRAT